MDDVDLIELIGHWQGDSLVAYIAEQIGHVGEWIHFVELAAFNQAVIKGGGFAATLRADKQVISSSQNHRAHVDFPDSSGHA